MVERAQYRDARMIDIDWIVLHTMIALRPCAETKKVALYAGIGSYPYMAPGGGVSYYQWVLLLKDWHKFDGDEVERYDWRAWWVSAILGDLLQRYIMDRHKKEPLPLVDKFKFIRDRAYRNRIYPKNIIAHGDGDVVVSDVVDGECRWFTTNIYTSRYEGEILKSDRINDRLPALTERDCDEMPYMSKRFNDHLYDWEIDYNAPRRKNGRLDAPSAKHQERNYLRKV